jgi:acetolactate synthase-1/2/3 large subunit
MAKIYDAVTYAISATVEGPIFALMGDGNMELLVSFAERRGRQIVHARHEQNAVAMADGYARFSGGTGLCSVTQGPGLTNTATSLTVARHHRSPVLLLGGQTSLGDMHNPQRLDQQAFTTATAGAGAVVENSRMLRDALDAAFGHLNAGRGPFVLNLPHDVQDAEAPPDWSYKPIPPPSASLPAHTAIERAADILVDAKHPAILGGYGAVRAGADQAIGDLARELGAPIAGSLLAKGLCSNLPLAVGVSGGLGEGIAGEALEECDVLLAIGSSLNQWTTEFGALTRNRTIIQIDRDPGAFGAHVPPTLALVGDARLTTEALCSTVRQKRGSGAPQSRSSVPRRPRPDGYIDDGGELDPRRVLDLLDEILPSDRIVVTDGGHSAQAICQRMTVGDPRNWAYSFDFGCIGQGLGLAIGACFARPGRRVTLITGDGSLMMALADLDTAARYELPLTVIVLNDAGFGQERHTLSHKGMPSYHANYCAPDFARLTESIGGIGHRLQGHRGLAELRSLMGTPRPAEGLLLLDIPINPAVELPISQELVRHIH